MCRLLLLLVLCAAAPAAAQTPTGIMTFFSARWYDRYEGEARIALVRQLEADGWFAVDTIYEWTDHPGETALRTTKCDLAPYVDDDGEVVYWVADVAPQFPGGKKALRQYLHDVIGPIMSGPDDEVHNSIYVRCTIATDGSILQVAGAQPHADWIPVETITRCLDAVRYMPAWSPGTFQGKPVRMCQLVEVALKE